MTFSSCDFIEAAQFLMTRLFCSLGQKEDGFRPNKWRGIDGGKALRQQNQTLPGKEVSEAHSQPYCCLIAPGSILSGIKACLLDCVAVAGGSLLSIGQSHGGERVDSGKMKPPLRPIKWLPKQGRVVRSRRKSSVSCRHIWLVALATDRSLCYRMLCSC